MTDTLATLISKAQGLLYDDGTLFDTTLCTAAAREALKLFNQYLPVHAGTLITGVNDQYEYELTAEDDRALDILDILQQGDNNNEIDVSIGYFPYSEDERLFFRLREPVTTSDTLIARYTIPQTINGLDSETETTIPGWQIPSLVTGIAAEAARIRGRSRVETINLSQDQMNNYLQSAQEMKAEYLTDLKAMSNRKRAAVGDPDLRAWNPTGSY